MKAANYQYLEFISSFDDHSKGNGNLTKVTRPIVENERTYRRLNFFAERDLQVLEAISRGEYMTFGMQGKDIRRHLENISASAMSRGSLNGSVFMGSLNGQRELINTSSQPMAKKSLLRDLRLEILCLYQHWHKYFFLRRNFAIVRQKALISGLKTKAMKAKCERT